MTPYQLAKLIQEYLKELYKHLPPGSIREVGELERFSRWLLDNDTAHKEAEK